ncbi:MAG: substrate-binding domain-containing protein [Anaerolineae bacterium]|nr:substrate-binding domain-containing protein [Anaerolineae bacterium]
MVPLDRAKARALLLLGCLLVPLACSPPPTPPTPVRLRLVVTPSLSRLGARLAEACLEQQPQVEVKVEERSPEDALEALATNQADLALMEQDLEPADALSPVDGRPWLRTWPLAVDALAIVVHPSNPVQDLTMDELRRAFAGLEHRWDYLGGAGVAIRLVTREPEAAARIAFDEVVLAGTHVAGGAVVMPGDDAVAQYVAGHPPALGYLSMAWAGSAVKVVALDGVLPTPATVAEGRYPLTLPVILVTPRGAPTRVRSFVGFCLGSEGQDIVGQLYGPAKARTSPTVTASAPTAAPPTTFSRLPVLGS